MCFRQFLDNKTLDFHSYGRVIGCYGPSPEIVSAGDAGATVSTR